MSNNRRRENRVAYCEEADQDGNVLEGAPRVAASVAASSPTKQKSNTSKSRNSRKSSSSPHYSDSYSSSDDGSTAHPLAPTMRDSGSGEKSMSKELIRTSSNKKMVTLASRPHPRHSQTAPTVHASRSRRATHEDPVYYGVEPEPIIQPASSRPRSRTTFHPNQRHSSYFMTDSSKPPLANSRWQQPTIVTAMPPPSFPPPGWLAHNVPPPPPPQKQEYFARPLSSRFGDRVGVLERPMSAMAQRSTTPRHDDYEPEPENRLVARRPSMRKKRDVEEDRSRMAPPRASSARPLAIRPAPFAPPPENPFDVKASSPYRDISPLAYESPAPPTRTRRPSVGAHTMSYDQQHYRAEIATTSGGSSRRNSYYGGAAGGGAPLGISPRDTVDDKLREAVAYQADTGGPTLALTAETLRKVSSKNGSSSRSTPSSASRDESDYRQSATTRTTRSSNEDDVTIRVRGTATLKFGGAELQCQDGAEINVTTSSRGALNGGSGGSGGGSEGRVRGASGASDRSSYIDPEERYDRYERHERQERRTSRADRHDIRPSTRTARAPSQSGSYSRTTTAPPMFDSRYAPPPPVYDSYGYPPPPPPPGPYSSSPFGQYSYF